MLMQQKTGVIQKEWKRVIGLVNVEPSTINGTFPGGRPSKTWNEVIKSDLKQKEDSMD